MQKIKQPEIDSGRASSGGILASQPVAETIMKPRIATIESLVRIAAISKDPKQRLDAVAALEGIGNCEALIVVIVKSRYQDSADEAIKTYRDVLDRKNVALVNMSIAMYIDDPARRISAVNALSGFYEELKEVMEFSRYQDARNRAREILYPH